MQKLEIPEELYGRIMAVREEVRALFEKLRIPGEQGDVPGRDRLDRVPALRKRECEKYLTGCHGEINKEKAAWAFLRFVRGETDLSLLAKAGLESAIEKRLQALRQSPEWMAIASQLSNVLGDPEADDANLTEPGIMVRSLQSEEGDFTEFKSTAHSAFAGDDRPKPIDAPTGKTTGARKDHIGELCHVKAEWRHSNLGPNEGRWLQLMLRFDRSYTRERVHNVELPIHVHRVHVEATLDGGVAANRDPWIESAAVSEDKVEIFEGNTWADERPCYEIDNPVRNWPLSGKYDWFDLCEVRGDVGENALLEISASIGGISISLPKTIRDQLDPNRQQAHETPELHLLEGWLRDREVPRSSLKGGGLYQLTSIKLNKRSP